MKIELVLVFTAEAHEQGSVVCDQCKQTIGKHEDFLVELPLGLISPKEVKTLHFEPCYAQWLEANRETLSSPIETLDAQS
jgi:hypothetical protein